MGKKRSKSAAPASDPVSAAVAAASDADIGELIPISREVFTLPVARGVMQMMGRCGISPVSSRRIGDPKNRLWRVEAKATLTQLAKFCVAECREQGKSAHECAEKIISYARDLWQQNFFVWSFLACNLAKV